MNTRLAAKLAALFLPLTMNAMLLVSVAYLYHDRSGGLFAASCAEPAVAVAAGAMA